MKLEMTQSAFRITSVVAKKPRMELKSGATPSECYLVTVPVVKGLGVSYLVPETSICAHSDVSP